MTLHDKIENIIKQLKTRKSKNIIYSILIFVALDTDFTRHSAKIIQKFLTLFVMI